MGYDARVDEVENAVALHNDFAFAFQLFNSSDEFIEHQDLLVD